MEKDSFQVLAEATKNYIISAEVDDTSDVKMIKELSNIILREKEINYRYKYNEKIDIKKTDKIVTSFLDFLNPYYKDYYNMRKQDGSFIFTYDNPENTPAYSAHDLEGNRILYIPLTNTIEDSYAIVHELMHDLNLEVYIDSITRLFYTEGLSLLSEFLLEFYLKNKHVKQFNNPNSNGLYSLKTKAIEVDFNVKLIESYIQDGFIDRGSIIRILEDYPRNYVNDLEYILYKIIDKEELTLDDEQPYIIGGLIATYMYDRIMTNKNNILELFELNKMLNVYEFDQVLDYLDLDYTETDLTENSYKILEDKYKKYLKSR